MCDVSTRPAHELPEHFAAADPIPFAAAAAASGRSRQAPPVRVKSSANFCGAFQEWSYPFPMDGLDMFISWQIHANPIKIHELGVPPILGNSHLVGCLVA